MTTTLKNYRILSVNISRTKADINDMEADNFLETDSHQFDEPGGSPQVLGLIGRGRYEHFGDTMRVLRAALEKADARIALLERQNTILQNRVDQLECERSIASRCVDPLD